MGCGGCSLGLLASLTPASLWSVSILLFDRVRWIVRVQMLPQALLVANAQRRTARSMMSEPVFKDAGTEPMSACGHES